MRLSPPRPMPPKQASMATSMVYICHSCSLVYTQSPVLRCIPVCTCGEVTTLVRNPRLDLHR